MKTILLAILSLLILFACSDNDSSTSKGQEFDPPDLASTPSKIVVIPSYEELAEMEDAVTVEVDYSGEMVSAYPLRQFIDYPYPHIYMFEVMSNDEDGNFSPRFRGMPDLHWGNVEGGYLLPNINYRAFFTDEDIVGTYNVRNLGYLRMYRKIDVISNEKVVPFQIGGLETVAISYVHENEQFTDIEVIPLGSFISDYVTTDKASHYYLLESIDSEEGLYSWTEISNAYIVDEVVLFIEEDKKQVISSMEWLKKITLVEDARL